MAVVLPHLGSLVLLHWAVLHEKTIL